jgi:hypothetical protein
MNDMLTSTKIIRMLNEFYKKSPQQPASWIKIGSSVLRELRREFKWAMPYEAREAGNFFCGVKIIELLDEKDKNEIQIGRY